jgi:hypothetical protein
MWRMNMNGHHRPDRKDLLMQLENYRLILDVNADLLASDPLLGEKIDYTLGMLNGHLDQLNRWEQTGDSTNYEFSIDQASRLLLEIRGFVVKMLGDQEPSSTDVGL